MELSKNNLQEKQNQIYIELETRLISRSSRYHNTYLKGINLELQGTKLLPDKMCRTSHPIIFAIGDLKLRLNQVIIAVGDGALAATAIWREIRRATGARPWLEKLPNSAIKY